MTRMFVLLCALAACSPSLSAQSVAPPGRSARLDPVKGFWGTKSYRVEISQGVALAMTCYHGGPCQRVRVISDNPAIAEARLASLGVLQASSWTDAATASALVIVGKAPGTTRVHVSTADGGREIAVTVIAPPVINAQKAAAPATATR
jgi:hypothetical protein